MKSFGVFKEREVSLNEINALISRLDNLPTEQSEVRDGLSHSERNSQIAWVNNDKQIEDLIWKNFLQANSTDFGFNIIKKFDIQYTKYIGKDNSFYKWHMDSSLCNPNMYDRKLTLVMMLSDSDEYEGGDLQLKLADDSIINCQELRTKGSIVVFPSFISHCVTPVTSGIRKTLVSWVEGAHFR